MNKMKFLISGLFILFSMQLIAQPTLDATRKAAVDSLALEKVRDLSKYIAIIGNKETPWSEAERVIQRALELFMPESQIGVSSLTTDKVTYYTIEKYFYRLVALNYEKVNIEWFDIQYVSDLELQPDGRYVGVITIFQKFEGVTKEGLVYKDTTKKDITIFVERKLTQINGRTIGFWDVLLGDIRVKETSK